MNLSYFYCNKPNARRAIQPTCRNGNYRTGGLPPRTLPFKPYDANKPPEITLIDPITGGYTMKYLHSLCDTSGCPPYGPETTTGVRYNECRQMQRIQRRGQVCYPLPDSAKYMRQPGGLGFVATPPSQVRMQMIKMMRNGEACCNGCTAKGQEDQDLINRAQISCPININISAAQLEAAGTTPIHRTGCTPEDCTTDGKTVKYFTMNWEDILGKSGMKAKLAPKCGPVNTSQFTGTNVSMGAEY